MSDLLDALRQVEKEAEHPVRPGETGPWLDAVLPRLRDLKEAWRADRAARRDIARQISEDDPGLTPRVERAEKTAQRLTQSIDSCEQHADEYASANEERLEDVEQLRLELLGTTAELRAFETQLRTWLVEAVYRDHGSSE